MGEFVCGIVASCLLAAPASLTLDGRPLSPVVEVWTLQEPAAPVTSADDEEPAAASFAARHPVLTGAIVGAAGGCIYGAAVTDGRDITRPASCAANAMFFSGVIAGTIAFARWYRDAAP